MADFAPALDYILNFEDPRLTYATNIDSNGGQVIAGVNSKAFPKEFAMIASAPHRALAVAGFYMAMLWWPMLLGQIGSQDLANRVLDMETNASEEPAAKDLQRAINAVAPGTVAVDGIVGPATIAAANSVDQAQLLLAFRAQRVSYYEAVEAAHPEDQPYLKTWLARAEA
jgi:lysozyme family protein